MIYGWLIAGLAALDLGIKAEVESEETETFPRELPNSKGLIVLHKNHNKGFPFGFLERHPEVVRALPLSVAAFFTGALTAILDRKDAIGEKVGLSFIIGGAISNLYDRWVRGYVVDYFSIQKGNRLKGVVFNLGDIFIFIGSFLILAAQVVKTILGLKKR